MIPLDLAGLVLVASRTLDLDEKVVLALADLEAAESVLTMAGDGRDPAQQAAILLVGRVRRQVFGPRSAEVAVMAALQVLALNGQDVGDLGSPAALRELVTGVAAGQVGADELAAWLAKRARPGTPPPRARGARSAPARARRAARGQGPLRLVSPDFPPAGHRDIVLSR